MKHRCIFLALTFSCLFSAFLHGQQGTRQNVIILFTDDQRWNTIHALGNNEIHTPNLDRLVKMGVSFTNAHVIGSYHGAVCAPSRAMLLTGKTYQHIPREFIDQGRVPPDQHFDLTILPEQLRKSGYHTFFTGKWHNNTSKISEGFDAGGNIFIGGMHWPDEGGHRKPQLWDFDPSSVYKRDDRWQAEKFSSEMYTDAALDFLENREPDTPFCLYVAYTSPHDPREAPESFRQMYDTSGISLPRNFMPKHPFNNGHLRTRDENLAPFPRTPERIKQEILEYYAMISEVDAQIGRILDYLEQSGMLSSTIIVFAGDNGLAVGQHGLLGKQNLYEHSVRVPLIIAAPGIQGDRKSSALCGIHDIYPTLSELLQIPQPVGIDGISLVPALNIVDATIRDTIFLSHARQMRAIKTSDNLKLIRYFVQGKFHEQLFDLSDDPWELKNLIDETGYREAYHHLADRLTRQLIRTGDAFVRIQITESSTGIGQPATIRMQSSIPESKIHYTLDGSRPGLGSNVYAGPLEISENTIVSARLFRHKKPLGKIASIQVFIAERIAQIELTNPPSDQYPGKGSYTLANGKNGTRELKTGQWIGYEKENARCLLTLNRPHDLHRLGIRYLDQPGNWIFPPTHAIASFAGPDKRFSNEKSFTLAVPGEEGDTGPKEWLIDIDEREVRYIRLEIVNQGVCPEWHPGKGKPAWLFLDEISVN